MTHYQYSYTEPFGFAKKEVALSENIDKDFICVKVLYVGICGSDLFHIHNCKDNELFLGHEWIGEVVSVGNSTSNLSIGDWVTTSATLGCGTCVFCADGKVNFCENPIHLGSNKCGALQSHLIFKSFNAIKIKNKDISETLLEVVAVAEEAINLINLNFSSNIKNALVLGGGTVGILCALLLKQKNIPVTLVEVTNERIERAKSCGINTVPLKQELLLGLKNSYDLILDATSDREYSKGGLSFIENFISKNCNILIIGKYTKAVDLKLDSFALTGSKLLFMRGVPLLTLKHTVEKWSGNLKRLYSQLVTHEFSSSNLTEAFEIASQAKKSGKVIIRME